MSSATDTPTAFIKSEPDWSVGFDLVITWQTARGMTRSGGEQMTGLTGRPKIEITFNAIGLGRSSWAVKRAQGLLYNRQQVVCPIWTVKPAMTAPRTFSVDPEDLLFYPGQYVYHVEGDAFYLILINSKQLTLEGDPSIQTTDTLIPCITGIYKTDGRHSGLDSTDVRITIESI